MIFSDNKKVIKIQNTLKNIPCPKGGVGSLIKMTIERLVTLFKDSLSKKNRDKDHLIKTITDEYLSNPETVYDFIIIILQNAFKRRKALVSYKSLKNTHEIFELISRILNSLASNCPSEKQKSQLLRKIEDYITQCARSTDKCDRGGIVDFLKVFKSFEHSDYKSLKDTIKSSIKLLVIDKNHHIRSSSLKLASLYSMKEEILLAVQSDPTPVIRKKAIDFLQHEDKFDANPALLSSLEDMNTTVRLRAIVYYLRTEVIPDSVSLQKLFIIMETDENNVVRSKSRELLYKLMKKMGFKELCDAIKLAGNNRLPTESQHYVISGFFNMLKYHLQEVLELLKGFFSRLIQEKEKIDMSSLFIIRICISVCKTHCVSFDSLIENLDLQDNLLKLLDLFLSNTEDYKADYYFKLQNMIFISYIDVEEHCREELINKYLHICKEIPLHRFYYIKNDDEINEELVKNYTIKGFNDYFSFASNEEDIISTIVGIVREIYQDSEQHYLLRLKHELIDIVINGVIAEETEVHGINAPLKLKIEKTDKKIKQNEEDQEILTQEFVDKKNIKAINEYDFDGKKHKLETKKRKLIKQVNEKNYRGLIILVYVLKHAELTENINLEYFDYAHNFLIPEIRSQNVYISTLALTAFGYFCLLSSRNIVTGAEGYYNVFLSNFRNFFEIKSIVSILFIFDLLLMRKIAFTSVADECMRCLSMNFDDEREIVRVITLEGFCKLLMRGVVYERVPCLHKIIQVYLDQNASTQSLTICRAFLENYLKISEEQTLETATSYLIYIFIHRKDQSCKKNSALKSDDRVLDIVTLFSPEIEKPYPKNENIQLFIFVFAFIYFSCNKKFFMKMISKISFEKFEEEVEKFTRNRLEELKNKYGGMSKDIEKCLSRLPKTREIVEDITFREYDLRVKDIETKAGQILKGQSISPIAFIHII